jgi:S1-C subfamily serine protease
MEVKMSLSKTFELVLPSLVAFITRVKKIRPGEKAILPEILGTGFVVDQRGLVVTNRHVVEEFHRQPPHPKTGASPVVAWMTPEGVKEAPGGHTMPIVLAHIVGGAAVTEFSSSPGPYYGEPVPDLAFVQLNVKDLPSLRLATEAGSWAIGTSVAILGYPLGTVPLELFGKVTQLMPSLKHGIIGSVQPFPCPRPHGFSTDILTQGGNSGSPVFLTDDPTVVGIHKGVVTGAENMTLAVPSYLISYALDKFLASGNLQDTSGVPTMQDLLRKPWQDGLNWEVL